MAGTTAFDVSKPLVHFISCCVKATTNNKVQYHARAHDIIALRSQDGDHNRPCQQHILSMSPSFVSCRRCIMVTPTTTWLRQQHMLSTSPLCTGTRASFCKSNVRKCTSWSCIAPCDGDKYNGNDKREASMTKPFFVSYRRRSMATTIAQLWQQHMLSTIPSCVILRCWQTTNNNGNDNKTMAVTTTFAVNEPLICLILHRAWRQRTTRYHFVRGRTILSFASRDVDNLSYPVAWWRRWQQQRHRQTTIINDGALCTSALHVVPRESNDKATIATTATMMTNADKEAVCIALHIDATINYKRQQRHYHSNLLKPTKTIKSTRGISCAKALDKRHRAHAHKLQRRT